VGQAFKALDNRNYRLYFSGQLVSVVGNGMQLMVQSWLVYQLTHSAYWLGFISVCSQLPAFFASPFAGVIADHKNRRAILMWVQIIGMLQAFALAILVYTGKIHFWEIAVLSVVLGILNAFEITTRHAFSVDLVGKKDLGSAIALNAATINISRVLGPAIGGLLLVPLGEAGCFVVNGMSYLAVVCGLIMMRLDPQGKKIRLGDSWEHLGEAVRYLKKTPTILKFMGLATFISFVGFSYSVLLPIVAKEVLHGDSGTLAILSASAGIGAITGAIVLGSAELTDIYKKIFTYVWLMGCGFVILGLSHFLWLSAIAMFFIGCFMMGAFPIINSSIQSVVEDSMRARVMSLYSMTFFGATPLGSLIVGSLADRAGTQKVAIGSGVICMSFGLLAPPLFAHLGPFAFGRKNRYPAIEVEKPL
jgi:MFS family permease